MNITILSVAINTKPNTRGGTYQEADVAFKNNTFQGKVEGKKIMSFGAGAESFKTLAEAQPGETYEVNVVKNDKGFNDWVSMQKASVSASSQSTVPVQHNGSGVRAGSSAAPKSNFETTEERAARQALIVRQSSLSNAVATLSVGAKAVKPEEVKKLAQEYNDWVFQNNPDLTGFETMQDNLPSIV